MTIAHRIVMALALVGVILTLIALSKLVEWPFTKWLRVMHLGPRPPVTSLTVFRAQRALAHAANAQASILGRACWHRTGIRGRELMASLAMGSRSESLSALRIHFCAVFPDGGVPFIGALQARAARKKVGATILWREFMSIHAVRLLRIPTTPNILSVGHRLKMTWVYAMSIAARVVKLKPARHSPDQQLISATVRHDATTIEPSTRVPFRRQFTWPKPALVRALLEAAEAVRKQLSFSPLNVSHWGFV